MRSEFTGLYSTHTSGWLSGTYLWDPGLAGQLRRWGVKPDKHQETLDREHDFFFEFLDYWVLCVPLFATMCSKVASKLHANNADIMHSFPVLTAGNKDIRIEFFLSFTERQRFTKQFKKLKTKLNHIAIKWKWKKDLYRWHPKEKKRVKLCK